MSEDQTSESEKNITGTASPSQRIRALNDAFRQRLAGGHVHITDGILSLGTEHVDQILGDVQRFTDFDSGNDPYAEHDFGAVDHVSGRIFWKIDYYDRRLEFGSPDPSDPAVTARVLTIMLASEY